MESFTPLLIVVFFFVKNKGLTSFLFSHFISFCLLIFCKYVIFFCKGPQASYSFKFFLFWFLQVSFLFKLCFVGHGLWVTINFLHFLYPSFSFFSSCLLLFSSSTFFLFPLFHSIKVSYFAFVASSYYMLCHLLLFIPHLSSLATIASHCHSPHMSLFDAIYYLMPFPLIVTCFIIIPSPFMHVVPTFHLHLFCHCYTYLLSPIAPLLVPQIFANPTFHCHIFHHFYVILVMFVSNLCSLGITFCPFL